MPSAVIRAFTYDEPRNELSVAFASGRVYVYSLVPPSVAASMGAAFSKGVYFNENIRDRYGYREITGDVARRAPDPQPSLLDRLKASRDD